MTSQSPDQPHQIEIADQQTMPIDSPRCIEAARLIMEDYGITRSEISLAFVDDAAIRELNRQYLNHDWETDVISFVLELEQDFLAGQLIVSTETAARVADEMKSSPDDEVLLYVIHGMLHLVGFDDTDDDSANEMRAAERDYLKRFAVEHRWQDSTDDVDTPEQNDAEGP